MHKTFILHDLKLDDSRPVSAWLNIRCVITHGVRNVILPHIRKGKQVNAMHTVKVYDIDDALKKLDTYTGSNPSVFKAHTKLKELYNES